MHLVQTLPRFDVLPPLQPSCNFQGPATGANTTRLPLHHSLAANGARVRLTAAHLRPSADIASNAVAPTTFRIVRMSDGAVAAEATNATAITAAAGVNLTLGAAANLVLEPGDAFEAVAVNVVGGEALQAVRLNYSAALQGVVG